MRDSEPGAGLDVESEEPGRSSRSNGTAHHQPSHQPLPLGHRAHVLSVPDVMSSVTSTMQTWPLSTDFHES